MLKGLNEIIGNNHNITVVTIIDIACVIAAILVIVNKNPIFSVLFLISLFSGIASHLIFSGLTFIGLSYLLVYVGAVSILFLFILMLINIRISELISETSNTIPLTLVIIGLFNYYILLALPLKGNVSYNEGLIKWNQGEIAYNWSSVDYVSSNGWDNSMSEVTNISNIGDIMYTNYSIWLIITSVILLLSMVGAIIITIKKPQN